MVSVKVDKVLDCQGTLCPLPVIMAKKAIGELAPGQVLQILATDPGAHADIPAWCRRTGHKLLEATEAGGVFRFLVERV